MNFWDQVIADQVGAVESAATALAFAVTAGALWGARRDKVREQAEEVSAWLEQAASEGDFQSFADVAGITVFLNVRNQSPRPVYSVMLASTRVVAEVVHLEVLPPGATERIESSIRMASGLSPYSAEDLRLWFIDSAGRAWTRGGQGGSLRRARRLDERPALRVLRRVMPAWFAAPWYRAAARATEVDGEG